MIEKMIGKRPNMFFMICWKYVSPIATLVEFFDFLYNLLLPFFLFLLFFSNAKPEARSGRQQQQYFIDTFTHYIKYMRFKVEEKGY